MKNKSGFSLVEVIIVVVILGILSMIAVPIYKGHVDRAYTLEGHALLEEVAASQEIYKDRFGKWWSTAETSTMESALGVNTSRNKYFRAAEAKDMVKFSDMQQPGGSGELKFTVTIEATPGTKAEGIKMVLNWTESAASVITATKKVNGVEKPIKGYKS